MSEKEAAVQQDFAVFLLSLAHGQPHAELTNVLQELVSAVKTTGRKGKLAVTITIEPASKSESDVMLVSAAVSKVLPKIEPRKTPFFVTDDDTLATRDPKQLDFGSLLEAPAPPTTLKEV